MFYEGAPYEKVSWIGAKAANKACVTVGYQHGIFTPKHIAVTGANVWWWGVTWLDVIVCLGKVTERIIREGLDVGGARTRMIGAVRRGRDYEEGGSPGPGRRTVLVVPQGEAPEPEMLFDCAIQLARALPDHRFVLRCHPSQSFEVIRGRMRYSFEGMGNVEISANSGIVDDLRRSSVMLYRGSSSVLYGVLMGVKPIYWHTGEDYGHEGDPLWELGCWRECAVSVVEVMKILHVYSSADEEVLGEEWQQAVRYVNEYIVPWDQSAVDRFLAEVYCGHHEGC